VEHSIFGVLIGLCVVAVLEGAWIGKLFARVRILEETLRDNGIYSDGVRRLITPSSAPGPTKAVECMHCHRTGRVEVVE
jgi:hypothetical protein